MFWRGVLTIIAIIALTVAIAATNFWKPGYQFGETLNAAAGGNPFAIANLTGPQAGPRSSVPGRFNMPAGPDLQAIEHFPHRYFVFHDGVQAPAEEFTLKDGQRLSRTQWESLREEARRDIHLTWHRFPQGVRAERYVTP